MKFVPLIIRKLLRNRRRTILGLLSIAVSTLIFAAPMSVPAVPARLLRDRVMRALGFTQGSLVIFLVTEGLLTGSRQGR